MLGRFRLRPRLEQTNAAALTKLPDAFFRDFFDRLARTLALKPRALRAKDGLIPLPGATSQAGKMCDQARARAFARKKLAIFGYIKGYTGWYVDSRAETS